MKIRPFEMVVLTAFFLLGVAAIALLSFYRPSTSTTGVQLGGPVIIWGTVDSNVFNTVLSSLIKQDEAYGSVQYVRKDPATFDTDLLNALADGQAPDVIFLPSDKLVQYRSKIQPIPYTNFPIPDFKRLYVDGAEIFTLKDGVYAYPIAIDPLVMYWNRSILEHKNILVAPTTWEMVVSTIVPNFVSRDFNHNVSQSPIAFGEYRNVKNASDIISMLTIQSGSLLVAESTDNRYVVSLNQAPGTTMYPLSQAVNFYTRFAKPDDPLYSWNRSRPEDIEAFLSESLVLYFGRGSEAMGIRQKNPNLNFGIAEVPQGQTATIRRTYGTFYGLALLKGAHNKTGGYITMQALGSAANAASIASRLGMAPADRASLSAGSNDEYGRIIYTSAIMARGWLSPEPAKVDNIFTQMVEDVLANRRSYGDAAGDAVGRLSQEY